MSAAVTSTITAPTFAWHECDGQHCCTVTYPAQSLTVCYTAQPDNPALTGYRLIRRLQRFTRRETT